MKHMPDILAPTEEKPLPLRYRHAGLCSMLLLPLIFCGPLRAQEVPGETDMIISDQEFEKQTGAPDIEANASPENIKQWDLEQDANEREYIGPPPINDPELDRPLTKIGNFELNASPEPAEARDDENVKTRYIWKITGLDDKNAPGIADIKSQFDELSELNSSRGQAESRSMISVRMVEDKELLVNLLASEGYFDAVVTARIVEPADKDMMLLAVFDIIPGPLYRLGAVKFDTSPLEPPDLITRNFEPETGDPVAADEILAAEANIAVILPQQGYPFAKVGARTIFLDVETATGDYTLPVTTGIRSRFGKIITDGDATFDARHIEILSRFQQGDIYDERKLNDLRAALLATGLLSTASIEPVMSGNKEDDGTTYADLLVRQQAGPARTLSASMGYGSGQGLRVEGGWTHRNFFPPEGAINANLFLGTREQGGTIGFRRANAGQRDRTVDISLNLLHSDLTAFKAYTGRISGRISRDSTPIWQKRITHAYGFELIATDEQDYDFPTGRRQWNTYALVALPLQIRLDTTHNLLDPQRGFRLNLNLSPESSLGSGSQIYGRAIAEATAYFSLDEQLVFAGRTRIGAIAGVNRSNLVPSRRFYGGGGGSVRGFGFQELGPKDPNNDPIGGRSMNEAAIEARYRFANYGLVAFVDAGQVYEDSLPQFDDWRFGVGVGARFYTGFGPLRFDIATPVNRRAGESRISVYVSIGQAF